MTEQPAVINITFGHELAPGEADRARLVAAAAYAAGHRDGLVAGEREVAAVALRAIRGISALGPSGPIVLALEELRRDMVRPRRSTVERDERGAIIAIAESPAEDVR